MTSAMLQPPGPTSVGLLETYFDANPKAASDIQTIASPLAGLSSRCKMTLSLPQVLGPCSRRRAPRGSRPALCPWWYADGVISGAQHAIPARPARRGRNHAGHQRLQIGRRSSSSFVFGRRHGPCRASSGASMTSHVDTASVSVSSGSSSFSVRNMKKNTTQPIAASIAS